MWKQIGCSSQSQPIPPEAWQQDDNRASYRARLMDAVQKQLEFYATCCNAMRQEVPRVLGMAPN